MVKKIILNLLKRKKMSVFKANSVFGKNFQVDAHSVCSNTTGRKDAIKIGNDCCVRGKLIVRGEGQITMGDNCYLAGNANLGSTDSITLGDCVMIARNVNIYDNNNHPVEPEKREEMCRSGKYFGPLWDWTRSEKSPVVINDNVWIGENVTILKGVNIGRDSVVACCSVVTKDVPERCIVAGNPAKVVKHI